MIEFVSDFVCCDDCGCRVEDHDCINHLKEVSGDLLQQVEHLTVERDYEKQRRETAEEQLQKVVTNVLHSANLDKELKEVDRRLKKLEKTQ